MNEKLSALVDSELGARERDPVFAALAEDEELLRSWDRYHLMGATMRGELQVLASQDLADRIARQIEREKPQGRAAIPPRRFVVRHAGGLALAASVAAMSIYGVRFIWPDTPQPAPLAASKVAPQQPATAVAKTDPAQRKWEKDLNALLVQHSEFSPTSGMGVMPYVRIAGHDDN